jgi:spermidine/putrescine transport system ATP-binding protein
VVAQATREAEGGAGRPDLEVEGLVKGFGQTLAVDDVSFSLAPGEFYSLLGPSGCGKTTTLRLVAGFELPEAGSIRIRGADVSRYPAHQRHVNTVFQHYALFPHLSVENNVGYGLRQQKLPSEEARRRLEDALDVVRLKELRDRFPRQLSGGQQQRVALARALVNEPAVLLLDEPLAALDLKLRKAMQGELKKLQERVAVTFLYVTHDQEEALTLSDRIAVMNGGRILQEGTPQEIYERPSSRFVADFIGQTNFFEGQVEETGAVTVVREAGGLILRCAPADWVTAGMHVAVAVRPEKIGPADSSGPANRMEGTLARTTYLGDLVQFHVALSDGRELVCQRQNERNDPTAAWRVGDRIAVGWGEGSALVLADDVVAGEDDLRLVSE